MRILTKEYTLDGSGTEIDNFNVEDVYEQYITYGTAVGIGNYAISITGTPTKNDIFIFKWRASLDITTTPVTFAILGTSITANQLLYDFDAVCTYNGTTWQVIIIRDSAGVSVDTANIANEAVTTSKIADDAITNIKLNAAVSSLKYGDAAGNAADLSLAVDEIPIGNGTTITTINKADLQMGVGVLELITIPISFETAALGIFGVYIYFDCIVLDKTIAVVQEDIAATNAGTITLDINGTNITGGVITLPASSVTGYGASAIITANNTISSGDILGITVAKGNPGGTALLCLWVQRT